MMFLVVFLPEPHPTFPPLPHESRVGKQAIVLDIFQIPFKVSDNFGTAEVGRQELSHNFQSERQFFGRASSLLNLFYISFKVSDNFIGRASRV